MKAIKKTLYTLDVDNYAPEIKDLTFPLLQRYARRIGADFHPITKRRYPGMPPVYEKMQIYELGRAHGNDWNIYVDADALIHPETIDFTAHLGKDTVAHNGSDFAGVRWTYDEYFLRDGRNIGSCNWFTVASDWCLDLWHPLELTLAEAVANIRPTVTEQVSGAFSPSHLIDDYTLSRNIAKFGLKFTTLIDLMKRIGLPQANFFWHLYTIPTEEKVKQMKEVLSQWRMSEVVA